MKFKIILQMLLWIIPWPLRRRIMCLLWGYSIHPTAHIGFSIVMPKYLVMEAKSRIFNFVSCKPVDRLVLHEEAAIGRWTRITGFPTSLKQYYAHVEDRRCELVLGRCATITASHYIDCNGGISIGEFTTMAGGRSHLMTHSVDIYKNRQDTKPIKIGKYCFVGSACLFLPGSKLPDYSVLGAHSVLNKSFDDAYCVYAGVPATKKKELDPNEVAYFHRMERRVL